MIRCEVVRKNGRYAGFSCKGHAGFDDSGKDVVCASVSILVINTINSIESFCNQPFFLDSDENTGDVAIRFDGAVNEKTALLMDSFVLGMRGIARDYDSTYVTFSVKEVAAC